MRKRVYAVLQWVGWILAAPILVIFAFAVINFGLTTAFLAKEHQLGRLSLDGRRLALSGSRPDDAEAARRFRLLYAAKIGAEPEPDAIRRYLATPLPAGGPIVLDQVMADYILARWGQIDGRTLTPGVYLGDRAIGPDGPPLEPLTKYLAQYAFYARHGYVLVVPTPESGAPAVTFSASRASDFDPDAPDPHTLMISPERFEPQAYDFPRRGQAIHELYRLSSDPEVIGATTPELTALAKPLRATGAQYGLFRQNSNTVLGCMLRVSDLHRRSFHALRSDTLLSLRLLGIGRPLWREPSSRPEDARCQ